MANLLFAPVHSLVYETTLSRDLII